MKHLVTNGSSITKGGGFENYQYRKDVRNFYKLKGVEVPIQDECTYTYHLGKLLNYEPINLAKCGSGIRRLVRTSYDWINNNEDKLQDTLFIFEIQDGMRMEMFLSEENKFGIVNGFSTNPLSKDNEYNIVMNWYEDKITPDELTNKYREKIDIYHQNFWSWEYEEQRTWRELDLFMSYVQKLNLNYYVSIHKENIHQVKTIDKSKILNLDNHSDIWSYARDKKFLIEDEIGFPDNHIGLEGNKIVAQKIYGYLNEKN